MSGSITFCCQSSNTTMLGVSFAFLEEVSQDFLQTYRERAASGLQGSLQRAYGGRLSATLHKYNTDPSVNKFGAVKQKISQVKQVALEAVEKAMARGVKLEVLIGKSETLKTSASTFEKKAKEVRDVFWWRNARVWAAIVAVFAAGALVGLGFFCKWHFATCF